MSLYGSRHLRPLLSRPPLSLSSRVRANPRCIVPLTPHFRHITGPSTPVKAAAAAHHAEPAHHVSSSSPPPAVVKANDIRPYANRTTVELINSLLVFQLCGMRRLVEASPIILEWAEKMKLHGITYAVIK